MAIVDTPRVLVDWHKQARPDGRRFRYRRQPRVGNFYLQVLRFELVVWYRKVG